MITLEAEESIIKQYRDKNDISMTEPFIRTQIIAIKKMARKYLILSRNTTAYYDLVGAGVLSAISVLRNYVRIASEGVCISFHGCLIRCHKSGDTINCDAVPGQRLGHKWIVLNLIK
jgi:hypothetical protein